jgi:phosphoribosylglycinamide formyltransferase-1
MLTIDKPVKTAVLVSGGGTNLQALLDAKGRGELPHVEFALVVSNNSKAYALERGRNAGIETAALTRKACPTQEEFEAKLDALLRERGIEFIILAGFLKIFSTKFVAGWRERIINIHPALIPSFCGEGMYGLHVHEAALRFGVKITGATVHYVNEIPDGGEIIEQKAVYIREDDTPETLQRYVMEECEWVILPRCAEKVAMQLYNERSGLE